MPAARRLRSPSGAILPPSPGPPPRPAEIHVFYDLPGRLDLVECHGSAAVPDTHGWEPVEYDGATGLVRQRRARHPAGRRELKLECPAR